MQDQNFDFTGYNVGELLAMFATERAEQLAASPDPYMPTALRQRHQRNARQMREALNCAT